MPPSMPRPTVCGLQAALSSCRISTVKTSTTSASPWRTFSTTPSVSKPLAVPPQSPRFITVPEPPQSSEPKLPPIKGYLPVPRDPFPRREGDRKVQPAYITAATSVSKGEQSGEPPRTEHEARRRAMAAARRNAFAAGIQGLHARKAVRVRQLAARSEGRRKANKLAAHALEPLDEELTRSTVRTSTARAARVAPDPERFQVAERAKARHARQVTNKAEARRDALAQLYVAAQSFIVDEAELEARVNKIFVPDHHKIGGMNEGMSIWDVQRAPVSVADLRAEVMGTSTNLMDSKKRSAFKTTLRQKTVAEELTGGKLV
ncbi:hypothetical protein BT67DRAFT_384219 [Trichocladium antarcticum]|uniref:Uncharacterized protein n=1 Tax=Trichocladium antarcticum TaxID=1450529 RepID=A0AAN6UGX1_9PEZI|nr:hypothetical protein BT67DRAFT_384219 [Trichocladium antarcticum]